MEVLNALVNIWQERQELAPKLLSVIPMGYLWSHVDLEATRRWIVKLRQELTSKMDSRLV